MKQTSSTLAGGWAETGGGMVEPSQAGHPAGMERIYHLPGTSLGCCLHRTTQAGIWWRKTAKPKQKRMGPVQNWKGESPKGRHIQTPGWAGSLVNWINSCTKAQKRLWACKHLHTWLTPPASPQPNLLWNVFYPKAEWKEQPVLSHLFSVLGILWLWINLITMTSVGKSWQR